MELLTHKFVRWIIFIAVFLSLAGVFTPVQAELRTALTTVAAHHSSAGYIAGETLAVSVSIEYPESLTALGYQMALPAGWSFVAAAGSRVPPIKPDVGHTGVLDFAWILPPAGPSVFTITLAVPEGCAGIQTLQGTVLFHVGNDNQQKTAALPDPLRVYPLGAGDLDGSGVVDLADAVAGLRGLCGLPAQLGELEGGRVRMADVLLVLRRISE